MSRPNSRQTGKRRRNRNRPAGKKPPKLAAERRTSLEGILGRKFKDYSLLDLAMTHSSAVPGEAARWSNERLEFLGDRVLGLVVAGELLRRFEQEREGGLAPRLNALVNRRICAEIGVEIGLSPFLIVEVGDGAAASDAIGGSIMANAVEAVIGALYLDGGLPAAEAFIGRYWKSAFKALGETPRDPKSELQERLQGDGRPPPVYKHTGREGPDHAPLFRVEVSLDDAKSVTATGPTKQEAEREAARAMLASLGAE